MSIHMHNPLKRAIEVVSENSVHMCLVVSTAHTARARPRSREVLYVLSLATPLQQSSEAVSIWRKTPLTETTTRLQSKGLHATCGCFIYRQTDHDDAKADRCQKAGSVAPAKNMLPPTLTAFRGNGLRAQITLSATSLSSSQFESRALVFCWHPMTASAASVRAGASKHRSRRVLRSRTLTSTYGLFRACSRRLQSPNLQQQDLCAHPWLPFPLSCHALAPCRAHRVLPG
jgi:hypothetical protein